MSMKIQHVLFVLLLLSFPPHGCLLFIPNPLHLGYRGIDLGMSLKLPRDEGMHACMHAC